MPLQKQAVPINFAQGLDTKTDPWQVPAGRFLVLENSVFNKGALLSKRNGFAPLAPLPDTSSTFATTFNGALTAIGTSLYTYSAGSSSPWIKKGSPISVSVDTLPLIRNNLNQSQADVAVSPTGLVCTVYTEVNNGVNAFKYVVANSVTGQNLVSPAALPGADSVLGTPRVFLLGNYFIIVYTGASTAYPLKYLALSTVTPTATPIAGTLSSSYAPAASVAFDGAVYNNNLYVAWNAASSGGIEMVSLSANLALSSTVTLDASHQATVMAVVADETTGVIWAAYYNSSGTVGYVVAVTQGLAPLLSATQFVSAGTITNITGVATGGVLTLFYEQAATYGFDSSIPTHFTRMRTVTQGGTLGAGTSPLKSVGLASKACLIGGSPYVLTAYQSLYQPTYFLVKGVSSANVGGNVVARLAYSNGGGYLTTGLPNVNLSGNVIRTPYLFKDSIAAVNKNTNVPSGTQVAGIYSQLGINLVTFVVGTTTRVSSEIGSNLNLSGGFLWMYDGFTPSENNFFLYPDMDTANPTDACVYSTSQGTMAAQPDGTTNTNAYFYQVTYEWTDNQGNAFRSAPSIPIPVTTTGSGSTSSVLVNVPTLRLTYKVDNPVKIVIYRWSVAQQIYYQVTSLTAPVLNDLSADSVSYRDTLPDAAILGNNILYTTGGVLENISPPATSIMTLFDDRVCLLDAEDKNLLWISKQVIESTPVEMSDLLTIYVAPTIGAQGSTGPTTTLASMDDKLILGKKNAFYYINGSGPDNTGANSQYSQPIFITATVGCSNQNSIVFQPGGLMFQSDKGIWLLGRDLSTSYIGAPVEALTDGATVLSAVSIPGTNQIRFTLDTGITLMYDYYYGQWGSFTGVPAISSVIYNGLHTYINTTGAVYQETPGQYLDGSNPVLMRFRTGWLELTGLQGLQRAYFFYLLGQYLSPHKLNISIAYDYDPTPTQVTLLTPDNYSAPWGGESVWGAGSAWGGSNAVENWRVFLQQQKCRSFQITIQELYDPSLGAPAGAGLTLSGLNLVIGAKKGFATLKPGRSVG